MIQDIHRTDGGGGGNTIYIKVALLLTNGAGVIKRLGRTRIKAILLYIRPKVSRFSRTRDIYSWMPFRPTDPSARTKAIPNRVNLRICPPPDRNGIEWKSGAPAHSRASEILEEEEKARESEGEGES